MLPIVRASPRSETFQNCREGHSQENGEHNRAGLQTFERFRLPHGTRKPIKKHHRRAMALKASADELEHTTVGDQLARLKKRPHFVTKRSAPVDLFTQCVTQ